MGSIVALICALTWSCAIIMFKKLDDKLHPVLLNLFKNSLGTILIFTTYALTADETPFLINEHDIFLIFLSGFIGIGTADALVLKALKVIGASRLAVIECAYSPSVIFLAFVFFSEVLTIWQVVGTALILFSIWLVVYERKDHSLPTNQIFVGSAIALAGVLMMAASILMIKPVFDLYPLLWIIGMRLVGGSIGSAVWVLFIKEKNKQINFFFSYISNKMLWSSSIMAAYVSMIFWVAGYKYEKAAIAAVLNQTATVFTVLMAGYFLKERLTAKNYLAAIIAFFGAAIIII